MTSRRARRFFSFALCFAALIALSPSGSAQENTGPIGAADYEALQKAGWQPDARVARLIRQARLGSISAMTGLGYRHMLGEGVLKSSEAAEALYTRAAQQGEPTAQLYLAALLEKRKDPASAEAALYWYRQSAARKNPIAMRIMADCYEAAKGTGPGLEKARALRREADEADPLFEAGLTLEEYDAALETYRRAARQGIAAAQYQLAVMYHHYFSSPSAAAYWYHQAARQRYIPAQLALGKCYFEGECGVNRDEAEAAKWYGMARESGNREGCAL